MVEAIQEGRKTMTRREIKHHSRIESFKDVPRAIGNERDWGKYLLTDGYGEDFIIAPKYQVGDRLWVKETYFAYGFWARSGTTKTGKPKWIFKDETAAFGKSYKYSNDPEPFPLRKSKMDNIGWFKRTSLFMPKGASRITLEVTAVRAEKVKEITEEDAIAEGVQKDRNGWKEYGDSLLFRPLSTAKDSFRSLWDSINGPYGTSTFRHNPYVWVITFKKIKQ